MGELLTLEEVGRLLKIKAETVRRFWILTGDLPAVRVGRQWRVDADEVEPARERKALKRSTAEEEERIRKTIPDPFSDLNEVIAPGGECTRDSEKDQLRRETHGREFTPPDIPE